jgi:hypothetical protein
MPVINKPKPVLHQWRVHRHSFILPFLRSPFLAPSSLLPLLTVSRQHGLGTDVGKSKRTGRDVSRWVL